MAETKKAEKAKVMAVDLGYSFTKVAYQNEDGTVRTFKFPSYVKKAKGDFVTGSQKFSVYTYRGGKYVVGEDSLKFPSLLHIAPDSESFSVIYAPLLLHHAFQKAGIVPDVLCVSISLAERQKEIEFFNPISGEYVKGNKSQLLQKACSDFEVNGNKYNISVEVFPQGAGIWLDNEGSENVIIIDIGYKTVDMLSIRDGSPLPEPYSRGFTGVGLVSLLREIADVVEKKLDIRYEPHKVMEAIEKGYFEYHGDNLNVADVIDINQMKNEYARIIFDMCITGDVRELYKMVGKIIVAGGGAYYIPDVFHKIYNISIPENPEYSNVRGFLKMLTGRED